MRDPTYPVFRTLYRYKKARRFLPVSVRDRLDSERKLLGSCLEACRRYQALPRSAFHRDIYGEILYREDVWSGETSLQGLSSVPLFDAAAASGDEASAKRLARRILDGLGDALHRHTWRTILAARALLIHDNLAICDRLLFDLRDAKEHPTQADIERVILTLFHDEAAEVNRHIVEKLVTSEKMPWLLINEWMRRCWLYEGASNAVLRDMLSLSERCKESEHRKLLLREPLALAFMLDDLSMVKKLLSDYPELEQEYATVLPLASYLTSHRSSSAHAEKVRDFARLLIEINEGSEFLVKLLRDKARSIAIVGNSPCELGTGKGQFIDSHDVVARFNHFSVEHGFVGDYGRKCTIHVRNPRDVGLNRSSLTSDLTLINRPDFIYRERKWKNVLALSVSGAKISALPTGFHQPLYRRLCAEPSAGVIFCALVKAIRGRLSREACFGFSFLDQIGHRATSAHYFASARPSFKHQWRLEKMMFEELTNQ